MKKHLKIVAIFATFTILSGYASEKKQYNVWPQNPMKIFKKTIKQKKSEARKKLVNFIEKQTSALFTSAKTPEQIDVIKTRLLKTIAWNAQMYKPLKPIEVTTLANYSLKKRAEQAKEKLKGKGLQPTSPIYPPKMELRPAPKPGFKTEKYAKEALKEKIRKAIAFKAKPQEILNAIEKNWEYYKPLSKKEIMSFSKEWIEYLLAVQADQ